MLTNNGKLFLLITFSCMYWWQISAEHLNIRNTIDKLDYWERKPIGFDTRRLQKKKSPPSMFPRAFSPVGRSGDLHDDIKYESNISNNDDEPIKLFGSTKGAVDETKKKKASFEEFISPYSVTTQITRILESYSAVNITIDTLGRTTEFNDIVLFKISSLDENPKFRTNKFADEVPEKKIVFIVHGLTVMGISNLGCLTEEKRFKILLQYYLEHLNKFHIFLIPIANPDGYAAAKSGKHFWNKNKSPQSDCRGVMLDRNFDVAWNVSHDLNSCSQWYPGPAPFSEAETKAIRDVFHYYSHKIIAYIHVHAGTYDYSTFKGDAILYPRGFTDVQSDDDKYIDLKGEIDEAMRNASFRVLSVTVDTLYDWYGKVSGSSVDYASSVYGIPYAMEFVMQLYYSDFFASQDEDMVDYGALTEIWRRIITVVFRQFEKSIDDKSGVENENMNEKALRSRGKHA